MQMEIHINEKDTDYVHDNCNRDIGSTKQES